MRLHQERAAGAAARRGPLPFLIVATALLAPTAAGALLTLGEVLATGRFVHAEAYLAGFVRDEVAATVLGSAWRAVPFGLDAIVVPFLAAAVGLVLVVRAGHLPGARAMALFLGLSYLRGHVFHHLGVTEELVVGGMAVAWWLALAALLRFAALFPQPLTRDDVLAPQGEEVLPGRIQRAFRALAAIFLRPRVVWAAAGTAAAVDLLLLLAPATAAALPPGLTSLVQLLVNLAVIGVYVLAVYFLRVAYRRAGPTARRRVLWVVQPLYVGAWVLVGSVAALAVLALSEGLGREFGLALPPAATVRPFLSLSAGPVLSLSVVLCFAFAVFYHGALDPGLAIRRTTVYGAVGTVIVGGFIVLESAISTLVTVALGLPDAVGIGVAGAVFAVAFNPVRVGVQRRVDRLIDRLLPATALAEEGARVRAVVAFADLTGYTRLTAEAEADALTLASALHTTARRVARAHGGRLVKTIGDAVLLAFPDGTAEAQRAVRACVEMARRYEQGRQALGLPEAPLRVGVHRGAVVRGRNGDVFGTTVNVAARLEGAAAPGEIVVSDAVAEALRAASPPLVLAEKGALPLKNVPEPVVAHVVCADAPVPSPPVG